MFAHLMLGTTRPGNLGGTGGRLHTVYVLQQGTLRRHKDTHVFAGAQTVSTEFHVDSVCVQNTLVLALSRMKTPLHVQPLAVAAVIPLAPPHQPLSFPPQPSKPWAACYPSHPLWKWQQCLCKLGSKSFTVLFHHAQMAGGYAEPMRGLRQDPALQPRSQSASRPDEPV